MTVGWLDWGIWGSFSDLLGDLSALSSYEDALAEAVYEELDYVLTKKEGPVTMRVARGPFWIPLLSMPGPKI